ncbi:MAG: 50S ribosomal protein L25 [Chitinispirillia bacterium]|nr:50S ribosomal protein L25 [Chitinispirillia bacterium]MCL2269206.1 50S ribosomal protein L25 [Chitinispirillia bacterium]
MEIIKLQARERTGSGKSYTRKARAQGWIPAVYYGHGLEPKSIEVPHKDFSTVVRGRKTSHLFDLGLGADSIAVIRQIQRKVLKDDVYFNLDFMHVNMKEKVTVDVHLEFAGVSIGVKDDNGVLGHPLKAVKVECFPADIPEKITIDVSALRIGDSIHVRDISIPNITFKHAPEDVLAVVTHPTREAVAKPAEEGAAATAAAPAAAAKPAAAAAKPAGGKK